MSMKRFRLEEKETGKVKNRESDLKNVFVD